MAVRNGGVAYATFTSVQTARRPGMSLLATSQASGTPRSALAPAAAAPIKSVLRSTR